MRRTGPPGCRGRSGSSSRPPSGIIPEGRNSGKAKRQVPMPRTYRHASREWRAFLEDVKERMSLESDNMAYTAVDAVLQVFRRRLTARQGLAFASVLPAVLRAIFVKDWDVSEPPVPFADRQVLTEEVRQVRVNHNLTPDNAIEATA